MKIGLAERGYQRVDLKCGADSFLVSVVLENDFEGVVYTRGSFDNKTSPCFKSYKQGVKKDKSLTMKLEVPFNECRTVLDVSDSRYTNTVIVQNDPEFIMPGDAAFALDCAFTPEFRMTTNIVAEPEYKSKITLVDADPSAEAKEGEEKYVSKSDSENVSFFPLTEKAKDEL
ncbi:UNVERIFIED_CONTAM: hypothetical protein PYX00_005627 [Menopon gallinae]|uniref:ZP domain-containing protein n=1 Tax=Menopon gallinae TaxID=328185 RepID=A0AAW2HSA8_9NEOP